MCMRGRCAGEMPRAEGLSGNAAVFGHCEGMSLRHVWKPYAMTWHVAESRLLLLLLLHHHHMRVKDVEMWRSVPGAILPHYRTGRLASNWPRGMCTTASPRLSSVWPPSHAMRLLRHGGRSFLVGSMEQSSLGPAGMFWSSRGEGVPVTCAARNNEAGIACWQAATPLGPRVCVPLH